MAKLLRKEYRVGSKRCLFEIGYRSLENGCRYVLNPFNERLERIFSIEAGFSEGRPYVRVETSKDVWYDVDGSTVLAKNLFEIEEQSQLDGPNVCEEQQVARAASA